MRISKIAIIFIFLITLIIPASPALARPKKGFHEGPYLRLIGGVISSQFDNNARTGEKIANDYEGVFGTHFGWNLWDSTASELELRYATKKVRSSEREHIFNINMNIKYSFVIDSLTDLGSLHILPFVKGGPAALISAVPGDPAAGSQVLTVWGLGFGAGAGIDFLIKKYLYFGFSIQGDFYYINPEYQNIGGTNYKIIAGGWEPQLGILGAAGVHF